MSEPKILNIVTPAHYNGWPSLFNNAYLRDGLITPLAVSSGGASDSTYVYASFGDNVNYVDYTMMLWINHNKLFNGDSFSYNLNRDGASVSGKVLTEYTNSLGQQTSLITFPKMNAKLFTFGWTSTNPANQEKSMGELILANENIITLTRDFSSYEERWREKVKEIILGDGGIHRVITLSGSGKNLRYEANCQFKFMTQAEVEALKSLKASGVPFYFQPESKTNPQNIYLCHWTGPWDAKYTSNFKGAGYTVSMQLKEVR